MQNSILRYRKIYNSAFIRDGGGVVCGNTTKEEAKIQNKNKLMSPMYQFNRVCFAF